jgi:hypothetical protein
MLSDYIICIYKGLNIVCAMGYDGTISKCRMRRVISPARLPLFLALLVVLCKWGCEAQLLTNFILTRHFYAGDIPNNESDMLWGTCGFFIQNYIAALTLGTMLNYLVRAHILRISYYLCSAHTWPSHHLLPGFNIVCADVLILMQFGNEICFPG